MAGEKLNEPTQESADAKEALSRSERNKQIREEIGNDSERLAERISGVDREKYDFDGYTDKQINMAMQGESFGDKDYARLIGKEQEDEMLPVKEEPEYSIPEMPEEPVDTIPEIENPGRPGITLPPMYGGPGSGQLQYVNQDNDINTTINGDGNTVTNNQDNSVRQYGASSPSSRASNLRDNYIFDVTRFMRK